MIKWLFQIAKNLFGGGASYIFLGIAGVLVFQHWQIGRVKLERDSLRVERDIARQEITQKDSLIEAQSRQFSRRAKSQKEQADAEVFIQSLPRSQDCQSSAAIGGALEWLRQHETSRSDPEAD